MNYDGDGLCRDCATLTTGNARTRCPSCGSPRLVRHPELPDLSIAHLDCDAFYAAVEKRDDPSLRNRPVIVGGGRRGVVSAACYVARRYGVHSAMPMFKALDACPDAVVIRPDMDKYAAVGRRIRTMMRELTPAIEPLSIDEAFLDLGPVRHHREELPATLLARLANHIEREIGIFVSIGLSYNKFLAKLASERDKPRGFAVIGRSGIEALLAPEPVGVIHGVGKALQTKLAGDGITRIGHLQECSEAQLVARYGSIGRRLYGIARGVDERRISAKRPTRSVSAETTFEHDVTEAPHLARSVHRLCERVAVRLDAKGLAAGSVILKLRKADFGTLTRSRTLPRPIRREGLLRNAALEMLGPLADGTPYRLIGVGATALAPATIADPPDLFDAPQREA